MIFRTVGPEYVPSWTRSLKVVGTVPTDFITAGRKPLDFQQKTVGEPFLLRFSGNRKGMGENKYLRATFFSSALLLLPSRKRSREKEW